MAFDAPVCDVNIESNSLPVGLGSADAVRAMRLGEQIIIFHRMLVNELRRA